MRVPVPRPGSDQVLIRVVASSLKPLEYKLADLNFFRRTPPVVLGLDLSGIVVATGSAVRGVAVGDAPEKCRAWQESASYLALERLGKVTSEVLMRLPEAYPRDRLREDKLQRQWTLDGHS